MTVRDEPQVAYDVPSLARTRWHLMLRDKYERALRYPWLPIEPDPPEPESQP